MRLPSKVYILYLPQSNSCKTQIPNTKYPNCSCWENSQEMPLCCATVTPPLLCYCNCPLRPSPGDPIGRTWAQGGLFPPREAGAATPRRSYGGSASAVRRSSGHQTGKRLLPSRTSPPTTRGRTDRGEGSASPCTARTRWASMYATPSLSLPCRDGHRMTWSSRWPGTSSPSWTLRGRATSGRRRCGS